MSFNHKIWSASFSVPSALAEAMAAPLGDVALAVTVFAPPRKAVAQIEALFDAEPNIARLTAPLAIIAMLHGASAPKLTIREMPKLDWLKKVAEDFPPLTIARWTIHGAQHRNKVPQRRYALQIDATNAFGTGEHPTTRGCLEMLDWVFKNNSLRRHAGLNPASIPVRLRGKDSYARYRVRWTPDQVGGDEWRNGRVKMLDMGCGSGILAMAVAQLYGGRNVAVDLDADSVMIAKNNATSNGLRKNTRIAKNRGTHSRLVHAGAPYDLIMANIFAKPLSHMAHDLKRHLRPGGTIILAGLLNHQANMVLAAHHMQKLYLVKRLMIGEWSILCLKRRTNL